MSSDLKQWVILAAGRGTRFGKNAEILHKALLPIDGKPVLTHILEKSPPSTPVVIAVGHLKSQLQDYLELAHPERTFQFIDVPDYDAPGSGPGASLLYCEEAITGPFFLTTIDTLVEEAIPESNENWLGMAPIANPSEFCTLLLDENKQVNGLIDKKESGSRWGFIGLAHIQEKEIFFKALRLNTELISNEKQLSGALSSLIPQLSAIPFTWFDTGTPENYDSARRHFEKGGFDFSKDAEHTYLVQNRVIKWFKSAPITRQRVERARSLANAVPSITGLKNQFFCYEKVPGHTVYSSLAELNFDVLLNWLTLNLWKEVPADRSEFEYACKLFYSDKTFARLASAFEKLGLNDTPRTINGESVESLSTLFNQIDWAAFLKKGIPITMHGDLQFDNILQRKDWNAPFTLIDWRQDFGGLNYGDQYYDLAKLNGGLFLNYLEIKQGRPIRFTHSKDFLDITIDHLTSPELLKLKPKFNDYCLTQGFDLQHIELITSLIFLNMAPLHTPPFDLFLLFYGQWRLHNTLSTLFSIDHRKEMTHAPLSKS